uniref:Large ribosomal subunit protein uL13m n=1 Tax=Eptatretus burgeri TaxID=7764 RepID=A0A8C4WV21_EPTBU
MSSCSRAAQQWATFARFWYLLDAKLQPPGKLAEICSQHLQGKHKPIYHATSDCGDHVVVINTRQIAFSGNKWEQKVYSSHTGYPGGFKQVTAADLHLKDPLAVLHPYSLQSTPDHLHTAAPTVNPPLPSEPAPPSQLQIEVDLVPTPGALPPSPQTHHCSHPSSIQLCALSRTMPSLL